MKHIILFLAICFALVSCSESSQDFHKRALTVADSITKVADLCFEMSSMTHTVWQRAVNDSIYYNPITNSSDAISDYNSALARWASESKSIRTSIREKRASVEKLFNSLNNSAVKSPEIINNISELYNSYLEGYDLAINPQGTFQSYTQSLYESRERYKRLKTRLESQKV